MQKSIGRTPPNFHLTLTSMFAKMFDYLHCSSGLLLYLLSILFRHTTAEEEGLLHASFKQYYYPKLSMLLLLFWCERDDVYPRFSL